MLLNNFRSFILALILRTLNNITYFFHLQMVRLIKEVACNECTLVCKEIIMHYRKSSFRSTAKAMGCYIYYCCPARLFNVTNLSLFRSGFSVFKVLIRGLITFLTNVFLSQTSDGLDITYFCYM